MLKMLRPTDLNEDEQLQRRCRYLATAFGFGQGCCVNVYLSAGGYLGDKFQDKYFFVWMCAAVYITPLLIFALARRLDPYFDRHFGFRKVYQVRLAISMLLGALLVAGLIVPTLGAGGRASILTLGAAVGMVAGSVASASAQFFGVISPKLVPLFFLGQTASGAYVNVAARLSSFNPDCTDPSVIWYYFSGVLVSVLPAVFFFVNHCRGGLDPAYRRHHRLTPNTSLANVQALAREDGIDVQLQAEPPRCPCLSATTNEKAFIVRYAFLCQVCLIGLNISLTPLANVLAHGKFKLGQEIVLLKLLGDFVGRVLFFCLPAPRQLRLHLCLNWAVVALRLPVWLVLVGHALSKEPWFSDPVLLTIWLPFVVSAAFGGSWLQVLAIQAADEQDKRAIAARMNMAVYYGFVSGVVFAAVFAFAAG